MTASPSISYAYRPRPTAGPIQYRLEDGVLRIDAGRRLDDVRLSGIESVRLFHAPNSLTRHGYKALIRLADGKSATLSNVTWSGVARFERQDEAYSRFMVELCRQVKAANPRASFHAGRSMPLWLMSLAAALAVVGAIVWLAAIALREGHRDAALVAGAVLALAAWQVEPLIRLNRPRPFSPEAPPAELLPGRPDDPPQA